MTKEQYIRHIEDVSGLLRPSDENGCMADVWKAVQKIHMLESPKCLLCAERRKTQRHNRNQRTRQDRKSTRLNSSHIQKSRMPSSA